MKVGERGEAVREEHRTEATDHHVERADVQPVHLGVGPFVPHVGQARPPRTDGRLVQHALVDFDPEHGSGGRQQSRVT